MRKLPDHSLATYQIFTGYTPTAELDNPQMGAVDSHLLGPRKELPPYVAIPSLHGFAGGTCFLSSKYGAFQLNADPWLKWPIQSPRFQHLHGPAAVGGRLLLARLLVEECVRFVTEWDAALQSASATNGWQVYSYSCASC